MISQIVWSAHLALAFVAMPVLFRLSYGSWPLAYRIPPRDAYGWVDFAYGALVLAFTACVLAQPKSGDLMWTGLTVAVFSVLLITWAVISMGASWRLGQDEIASDRAAGAAYVTHGPFRIVRHPIYVGLIGLSAGMALMRGADWYTVGFLVLTVAYTLRQARAETRHWLRQGARITC